MTEKVGEGGFLTFSHKGYLWSSLATYIYISKYVVGRRKQGGWRGGRGDKIIYIYSFYRAFSDRGERDRERRK